MRPIPDGYEITVSTDIVVGCTYAFAYVIRDPNSINGVLALATSALIAGRPVDLYVSGSCDANSGEPLISQITLH